FALDFVDPGTNSDSRTAFGDAEQKFIAFQHFGAVVNVVIPSCETGCDDGQFCNGVETCVEGECASFDPPCTTSELPACDEGQNTCVECLHPAHCDDVDPCTFDQCNENACVHGVRDEVLSFEPVSTIPGQLQPGSALFGDLSGDGVLDVAWAGELGNTVEVAMGLGNGEFGTPSSYSVGNHPRGIALADLDGDGDLDLASANQVPGDLSVLLNRGDGVLEVEATYPTGSGARYVTAADVDRDGDVDLGVANQYDNTISVFLNNGDGGLGDDVLYATDNVRMLLFHDVDGDGFPDLVSVPYLGSIVSVRYNVQDGTFSEPAVFAVSPGVLWVDAGDVDGDGDDDLVCSHNGSGSASTRLTVLMNDGAGSFAESSRILGGHDMNTLRLLDVEGDGDLDAAYTDFGTASLWVAVNDGNGSYTELGTLQTGINPRSVDAGDINGDGLPDLVVASLGTSAINVFRNVSEFCMIEGECFVSGEENPYAACEFCEPVFTRDAWTLDETCLTTTCARSKNVAIGTIGGVSDEIEPDDDEAGCHPNSNGDTWFLYTAECTGTHVVSTTGSAFVPVNDTVLSVFDECGGSEIACDDDGGPGLLSEVRFQAVRGETYYIRVAGAQDNAGDIVLNIGTIGRCIRTTEPTPTSDEVAGTGSRTVNRP
ncbi:MAG: VCBS repeat-containing protein, partial [Myxococcales bacterium]